MELTGRSIGVESDGCARPARRCLRDRARHDQSQV